ncbi:MAG: hypothetical protein Alpg2KO_01140 [Alphaproteobacteria bacterium]
MEDKMMTCDRILKPWAGLPIELIAASALPAGWMDMHPCPFGVMPPRLKLRAFCPRGLTLLPGLVTRIHLGFSYRTPLLNVMRRRLDPVDHLHPGLRVARGMEFIDHTLFNPFRLVALLPEDAEPVVMPHGQHLGWLSITTQAESVAASATQPEVR